MAVVSKFVWHRGFVADRRGSTAVEFALVALPFFGLLFAILETALIFLAGEMLQTAVTDASRAIMTGKVRSDTAFRAEICKTIKPLFSCETKLAVDVRTLKSLASAGRADPYAGGRYDPSGWGYEPGAPGSVMIVTAAYPWPTFVNLAGFNMSEGTTGVRVLVGAAVFRNEQY